MLTVLILTEDFWFRLNSCLHAFMHISSEFLFLKRICISLHLSLKAISWFAKFNPSPSTVWVLSSRVILIWLNFKTHLWWSLILQEFSFLFQLNAFHFSIGKANFRNHILFGIFVLDFSICFCIFCKIIKSEFSFVYSQ